MRSNTNGVPIVSWPTLLNQKTTLDGDVPQLFTRCMTGEIVIGLFIVAYVGLTMSTSVIKDLYVVEECSLIIYPLPEAPGVSVPPIQNTKEFLFETSLMFSGRTVCW